MTRYDVEKIVVTTKDLAGANLIDANLTDANLTMANLTMANLAGANLIDAYLIRAKLTGANLTGANLTGAKLTDANLTGAKLTDANLIDANLTDANLTMANLTGANLTGARYNPIALLCSINWGTVPDNLCIELMRRDAEICGSDKMQAWADGRGCPFSEGMLRGFHFAENRELWSSGKPELSNVELFCALCEAKKISIAANRDSINRPAEKKTGQNTRRKR